MKVKLVQTSSNWWKFLANFKFIEKNAQAFSQRPFSECFVLQVIKPFICAEVLFYFGTNVSLKSNTQTQILSRIHVDRNAVPRTNDRLFLWEKSSLIFCEKKNENKTLSVCLFLFSRFLIECKGPLCGNKFKHCFCYGIQRQKEKRLPKTGS